MEAEYQSSIGEGIDEYGSSKYAIAEYAYRRLNILSNLAGPKKCRIKKKKKWDNKYAIVQDSRKDNKRLLLVDRNKSKEYWWTHDLSIALVGTKEEMDNIIKKLRYNNPQVISINQYLKD